MADVQLVQLPVSGVLDAKGSSLEEKFVSWLNSQEKARDVAQGTFQPAVGLEVVTLRIILIAQA